MAEKPINAFDCRTNLLSHISDVQTEVESRLESLESLFEGNSNLFETMPNFRYENHFLPPYCCLAEMIVFMRYY